jgi:opacity protein-like surface antigen
LQLLVFCVAGLGLGASPASAQPAGIPELAPDVAVRPFVLVTAQRFAATETFNAVFGRVVQPFVGGGAQLALSNGLYIDAAVSRFSKTGERAFLQGGASYGLGIPLSATIVPIEVTAGYRFGAEWSSRLIPYVGAGIASYKYTETADFAEPGDNVDQRGTGFLVVGGAEFRLQRWVIVAADVQVTRVGGILGEGGVSQQAGENNLGGVAARFRVMIGR